jgi:hypothetical protein
MNYSRCSNNCSAQVSGTRNIFCIRVPPTQAKNPCLTQIQDTPKTCLQSRQKKINKMKKTFLFIMLAVASLITITQCNPQPDPKPSDNPTVTPGKKTSCDSCTIDSNYCNNGALADIKIDKFEVTKVPGGPFTLKVHVINIGDDNAKEAKLVVLLPLYISNVRVTSADPLVESYKRCGGEIEFCLGSVDKGEGETDGRSIEIQGDSCQNKMNESFAGFVYSSTPDWCPVNNFSAWVNTASICNTTVTVKKGLDKR